MNAVAINPLQNFKIRFQNFFPLCKPRVSALIVFTAIIGMFLATPNMVPLDILIAATVGIGLCNNGAHAWKATSYRPSKLKRNLHLCEHYWHHWPRHFVFVCKSTHHVADFCDILRLRSDLYGVPQASARCAGRPLCQWLRGQNNG